MGVLSFISDLQQRQAAKEALEKQLAAQMAEIEMRTQGNLKQIEAQKAADIEIGRAAREGEFEIGRKKASDVQTDTAARKQKLAYERMLQIQNANPEMHPGEAWYQAQRDVSGIELEPEMMKQTTAANINAFNRGRIPLQQELGTKTGLMDLSRTAADTSKFDLDFLINKTRASTAPRMAAMADTVATEEGENKALAATSSRPFIPTTTAAQADSAIQKAKEDAAKSVLSTAVTQASNTPEAVQAAAEAANTQNQATTAVSELIKKTGGIFGPGAGNAILGSQFTGMQLGDSTSPLIRALTNAIPGINPGINIGVRRPIANINDLSPAQR